MMLPELHDEITRVISGETIPAYVFTRQSAGEALWGDTGSNSPDVFVGFSLATTLHAIVEPDAYLAVNDDVIWDGGDYIVSSVARRRTIDGEDHHITVTLDRPS